MSFNGENGSSANTGGAYTPDYGVPEYDPLILDIDRWGDDQADENRARLTRAQWWDYKNRFVPIENELIGQIGNRQVYSQSVSRALDAVDQSFDTSRDEMMRGLSRYGAAPSAQETQTLMRQSGRAEAAAKAGAANRTRTQVKNRNMQILGGSLSPTGLKPKRK